MKKLFLTLFIILSIIVNPIVFEFSAFAEGNEAGYSDDYRSLSFMSDYSTREEVRLNGIHKDLIDGFESKYLSAFCNPYGDGYISSPLIIDAEKTPGTKSMCWAASTANILQYSGWVDKIDKSIVDFDTDFDTEFYDIDDEDAIFNYFVQNFDNKPSNTALALTWFFNKYYDVPDTQTSVARPQNDTSGGLLPQYLVAFFSWQIETNSNADLVRMMDYLDAGSPVSLMMNWRNGKTESSGNHVITVWGYTCDTKKARDQEGYCMSLLYTDSDDDEFEDYFYPTPNRLRKMDIKICSQYDVEQNELLTEKDIGKIYSDSYLDELTLVSSNILAIAPPTAPKDNFSTCVTTIEDSYNFTDGEISFREAVAYAKYTNTKVTFAPSLSGKVLELSKPLTIKHKVNIDATTLSSRPTIKVVGAQDGDYGAIQLYDTASVVINGFNITSNVNGSTLSGVYNNGNLTLRNCKIFDNDSDVGGGVYNNSYLVLDNCEIVNNHSKHAGGGVYCTENASILIKGVSKIIDNTAGENVRCNLVTSSTLIINDLAFGSKIGIYINSFDKDDPTLCSINPELASTILSYLEVDNPLQYNLKLAEGNTKIVISKQSFLGCGTISFDASYLMPIVLVLLVGIILTPVLKRKYSVR